MQDVFFFGYGSLVNRATHDYGTAHHATLPGWRRAWRHTALRPVAFLTAERDPASRIAGLIAAVPGADWAALDRREAAYLRHPVCDSVEHPLSPRPAVSVYAIPENRHAAPSDAFPVLLSYLDVVVQGYAREYGAAGVADFFATTSGWEAPILDDRADPIYPRHQRLTPAERALTDDHLARIGARIITTRPEGL
ncbi:gamma-glutamylcyclotransferase [Seohaeicola sp. SP36]|uniref:gamma-glutamylcyclotransferase family protein n=1 Tax=unclassified Seohaeicola TaxID=2641111 RepID=UPI00237B6868|nr:MULTISPECIES: gamma-glutamylcyclotransferase family protein [unclassified Seohaeicola]MDD9706497.1 gamma-glutamylcyclotransferase [Seohaeicola sp. 4SK31]MDD9737297.1 gamma-glutamylcyclotransferase [Seohaeicola sp. SP36]